MKRRAMFLAVLGLVLIPATALAATATMTTPRTARLGSRITASASGLKPGSYSLWLSVKAVPGGASPTYCTAKIGATVKPAGGKLKVTGAIPSRLGCYQGVGKLEGYRHTTAGGKYLLTLGDSFHPNGFEGSKSLVVRHIALTR